MFICNLHIHISLFYFVVLQLSV